MNSKNQIYTRKSTRNYLDDEVDLDVIPNFLSSVKTLDDSIDYNYDILTPDEMNILTRWKSPYYLSLYSENKDLSLENIGFVFQQLSLYLQSIDIGSCWVGMASPKKKSDDYVISMSFGKSDRKTRDRDSFKRKKLDEISDAIDEKLIPAQLAPSAMNSQPWFFKHADDGFDVYQVKQNVLKRRLFKTWNPIDMGIALAHMYVANEESFEFYKKTSFDELKGYTYTGSIKI